MKQKFGTHKSKREKTLDELTQDMGFYDKDMKFSTAEEYIKEVDFEEEYDRFYELMCSEELAEQKTAWRVWAKALGEKSGETNEESDKIAMVRTIIVGVNFITCLFIVSNIIRGWILS